MSAVKTEFNSWCELGLIIEALKLQILHDLQGSNGKHNKKSSWKADPRGRLIWLIKYTTGGTKELRHSIWQSRNYENENAMKMRMLWKCY